MQKQMLQWTWSGAGMDGAVAIVKEKDNRRSGIIGIEVVLKWKLNQGVRKGGESSDTQQEHRVLTKI